MKNLFLVLESALAATLILSASGCATYSPQFFSSDNNGPRFHDESQVNAVLQFSSWDWTFLVRPEYSKDGYLERVRPDSIGQVFDLLNVQRGTAVVVVGWTYNGGVLDKLVTDWKSILGRCGFRRVVVLRAQDGNGLNGSVIIDDSILHVSSAQSASQGG
jgi:hypothetical protein